MRPSSPARRVLRRTASLVGVGVALTVLGTVPAGAADPAPPGLVLGDIAAVDGVKPGSEFPVPASFTNTGGEALDRVWTTYSVTRGLGHTELPANCSAFEVRSADEEPSRSYAVCEFDQPVRPGVVYAPQRPLTLKALDHALYDDLRVVVSTDPTSPSDFDGTASEAVRGTGPAVKLVERPEESPAAPGSAEHETWDAAHVKVTADSTADFQVTGAQLEGEVGETVPLRVTLANAGPGWVLREIGAGATRIRVTMPPGTSVVKSHGFCHDIGSGTYECGTAQAWFQENAVAAYDFRLKIDKAVRGSKGAVTMAGRPRPFDPVAHNDTAVISLDVVTGGTTGGSDGGGSASAGGTGSSGSQDATGGTTGGSPTGGTPAGEGAMPDTGAGSVMPLAAATAGALVLGAGAVLAARRRTAAALLARRPRR